MSVLRIIELVIAGLFFLGGFRSFWIWSRRPIDSNDIRDQIWYTLYRTGRIGLWFAVGGIFLISGLIQREGKAFSEEWAQHRWYLMVLLILAAMQLVGGYLLGRSADRRPSTTRANPPPQDEA
ncbi:MAG TPA: hypothetical protein VID47_19495 [Actinomycetota bacterium]